MRISNLVTSASRDGAAGLHENAILELVVADAEIVVTDGML
jgi:hypothetical protein